MKIESPFLKDALSKVCLKLAHFLWTILRRFKNATPFLHSFLIIHPLKKEHVPSFEQT